MRGAAVLFGTLMLVRLHPLPGVPLSRWCGSSPSLGIDNSLPGIVIVHTIFGLPIDDAAVPQLLTPALPLELFKAARIDGAGFWRIFGASCCRCRCRSSSSPSILQVTGIWNDFIFGVVFAGRENLPMTVQLNNIVNSTQGEREYNVDMAATMLTALVPLVVYFVSGRWFVRGIAAGAVKG